MMELSLWVRLVGFRKLPQRSYLSQNPHKERASPEEVSIDIMATSHLMVEAPELTKKDFLTAPQPVP